MKNLAFLFSVLAVTLLGACRKSSDKPENQWHKVQTTNDTNILQEIGILEAEVLSRLQIQVSGTVSEAVEDGSPIQTGELVLKLDEEELRTDLETEMSDLDQLKEDLENEMAEYAVLTNTFGITSRLKEKGLEHAELELEKTIIPLLPEEQRLREIEIELATLDLEDKITQLAREEELVRKNFAPASSLQSAEREKQAAETYLAEKRSQLKLDSMPLPEEERLTLETAVKNAEDAVRRNQQQQDRDLYIQDLKIEGIKLQIEHTIERITKIREQLGNVSVVAPNDGILRLSQEWSRSVRTWMPITVGQNVNGLDIVGNIVDPDNLTLRVIIHESDYPLIKAGQKVQATLISFPDETLKGKVENITELGQDLSDLSPIYRQTPSIRQAMFLVNITLEETKEELIPGMTALVEIYTETGQRTIYIPQEALREEDGKFWVRRRRDNAEEKIEIKGVMSSEGRFEVREGLLDGDEVLIQEDVS